MRHDFGGRGFGRKISRRPNMRASSEKPPGPSSATAIARTIKPTENSSTPDTPRTPAPNVTTIAITGVIRPTSKQAALITLRVTRIQPSAVSLVVEMCAAVCASNVKLTKPRRRRRPMPGQPLGKAENSFCRTKLLQVRFHLRKFTDAERSVNPEMQVTLRTSFELYRPRVG